MYFTLLLALLAPLATAVVIDMPELPMTTKSAGNCALKKNDGLISKLQINTKVKSKVWTIYINITSTPIDVSTNSQLLIPLLNVPSGPKYFLQNYYRQVLPVPFVVSPTNSTPVHLLDTHWPILTPCATTARLGFTTLVLKRPPPANGSSHWTESRVATPMPRATNEQSNLLGRLVLSCGRLTFVDPHFYPWIQIWTFDCMLPIVSSSRIAVLIFGWGTNPPRSTQSLPVNFSFMEWIYFKPRSVH